MFASADAPLTVELHGGPPLVSEDAERVGEFDLLQLWPLRAPGPVVILRGD